ncbi:MAG: hypothetical protein ABWZ52_01785 [Acidimicrobiales bacterium]
MVARAPDVSPLTRHLVHAFLLVFAVTGIARLELYPFSGFRLFSEVRGENRTSYQLRAVDDEGEEVAISLGHMPLGYRQTAKLVPGLRDLSQEERDEICDAWAQPLRERGVEVVGVRIYRQVASVRPDGPPPERTLLHECGGRAL